MPQLPLESLFVFLLHHLHAHVVVVVAIAFVVVVVVEHFLGKSRGLVNGCVVLEWSTLLVFVSVANVVSLE